MNFRFYVNLAQRLKTWRETEDVMTHGPTIKNDGTDRMREHIHMNGHDLYDMYHLAIIAK